MKVLIIGGVAGGASTAARLRRLNDSAEIIIFERGKNISFANCGIPYYCGDVIGEKSALELLTPEKIRELLNIEARTESEVLKINRNKKTITVKELKTGREYEENYDKLVLSPGAKPIKPNIPSIGSDKIYTVRNLDDAERIKKEVQNTENKRAVVVGAGYIGLEIAENLAHLGLEVTLVEKCGQILNNVDIEIACQLQSHLQEKGVKLLLNEAVVSFTDIKPIKVNLENTQLEADVVILAIGVVPESDLAQEAGLEIGKYKGIKVNEYMQTSDPDIYAVGDAVEVKDFISRAETQIPLAGPANRQGRIAAQNIAGMNTRYETTLGTSILKLFDLTVGMTGNNEKMLKAKGIPYLRSYAQAFSHADYYPGATPITIKLLFSPKDGKILGTQIIGKKGVDKRTDVIAAAIQFEKTVKDLIDLELSYAPPYGSAKDPVNIAGMIAENILNGFVKPVYWDEIDKLPEDIFMLDVRADEDLKKVSGTIDGALRIPLEELRERIDEIPKNRPVLVYCAKGLKSYFAARILVQNGFKDILSLNGGFMVLKTGHKCKNTEKFELLAG